MPVSPKVSSTKKMRKNHQLGRKFNISHLKSSAKEVKGKKTASLPIILLQEIELHEVGERQRTWKISIN